MWHFIVHFPKIFQRDLFFFNSVSRQSAEKVNANEASRGRQGVGLDCVGFGQWECGH